MRISAKRAAEFRYAFRAGKGAGKYGLPIRPKTTQRWWVEAYFAGYDYGMAEHWPDYRYFALSLFRWSRHRGEVR